MRRPSLRRLRDPSTGRTLDEAIVLRFEAPFSHTGEDMVEFHVHGSLAAIDMVQKALGQIPRYRVAEPGEFTRRALLNGRTDLVRVEGLGALLEAETAAQHSQALRLMDGELGIRIDAWRTALMRVLALLEATIDFADEDIPEDVLDTAMADLSALEWELAAEIAGAEVAERVAQGFEVALVGPPNVGKSTLLNRLARRDAALVSEVAGTTRDVIEVRMDLRGLPVTLLDMAGLRESQDRIEAMGVDRARTRAAAADLRVFLRPLEGPDDVGVDARPGDIALVALGDTLAEPPENAVSGKTGLGVDRFLDQLGAELSRRAEGASLVSTERQRAAVGQALEAIRGASAALERQRHAPEIAADDLRAAVRNLDILAGRMDVEGVLSVIFKSFCLGK